MQGGVQPSIRFNSVDEVLAFKAGTYPDAPERDLAEKPCLVGRNESQLSSASCTVIHPLSSPIDDLKGASDLQRANAVHPQQPPTMVQSELPADAKGDDRANKYQLTAVPISNSSSSAEPMSPAPVPYVPQHVPPFFNLAPLLRPLAPPPKASHNHACVAVPNNSVPPPLYTSEEPSLYRCPSPIHVGPVGGSSNVVSEGEQPPAFDGLDASTTSGSFVAKISIDPYEDRESYFYVSVLGRRDLFLRSFAGRGNANVCSSVREAL